MPTVPFSVFYETATGKAISFGSVVDQTDAELAARGITRQEVPAQHMDPQGKKYARNKRWNPDTKDFDTIVLPRTISTSEFWDRFTDAEQEEIWDRANAGQKKFGAFMDKLRIMKVVDLNNTRIVNAVSAMEAAAVIGTGRAAEILA